MSGFSHPEISALVCGLLIRSPRLARGVDPKDFAPPFDDLVRWLRKRRSEEPPVQADLLKFVDLRSLNLMTDLASGIPDDAFPSWVENLRIIADRERRARELEKAAERMRAGESPDLRGLLAVESRTMVFRPASEFLSEDGTGPWIPTGFRALDRYLGGVPDASLTTIGGDPGAGKTSLALAISHCFLRTHPQARVAFFSIEMTGAQLARRLKDALSPDEDVMSRLMICDEVMGNENDIYAAAYSLRPDMIVVDFAQLLLFGDTAEARMGAIAVAMSRMARDLRVPVLMLSQLSRAHGGTPPTIHDFRYSGMIEAVSALALLVWNPDAVLINLNEGRTRGLSLVPGKGHIIIGKSRFGYGVKDRPFSLCVGFRNGMWDVEDEGEAQDFNFSA
jgi:hypothetical protein